MQSGTEPAESWPEWAKVDDNTLQGRVSPLRRPVSTLVGSVSRHVWGLGLEDFYQADILPSKLCRKAARAGERQLQDVKI